MGQQQFAVRHAGRVGRGRCGLQPSPVSYWSECRAALAFVPASGRVPGATNEGAKARRLTMTAAGVTIAHRGDGAARIRVSSSAIAMPNLQVTRAIKKASPGWTPATTRSTLSVNQGTRCTAWSVPALATGYKFFGQHDWYRELAGL